MSLAAASGALVLVVDDEPRNLQVVGAALMQHGFRVSVAVDGQQALEAARNSLPDVILLDVMLPGIDGFAICRELKADARTMSVPVIFLTARTDGEDVLAGFAAGGVDYVAKPFRAAELIARVRAHAELKRLRGLLVICSFCRRIRNEDRDWEAIDHYVMRHTDTLFSHGLCERCAEHHYP